MDSDDESYESESLDSHSVYSQSESSIASMSQSETDQEEFESKLKEVLVVLEEHRKNCEKEGNYIKAELCKNRFEELRLHLENRKKEAMRTQQIAERLQLDETHLRNLQELNSLWDKNLREFEIQAEEQVHLMKERHTSELRDYQKQLIETKVKPKYSRELLAIRKIQEAHAQQKEYADAQKFKLKGDALEREELEAWHQSRQSQLLQKEGRFKKTKQIELLGLLKKIQTSREEQKKLRHESIEKLMLRHQNAISELEAQHSLERQRLEKLVSSGAFTPRRLTTFQSNRSIYSNPRSSSISVQSGSLRSDRPGKILPITRSQKSTRRTSHGSVSTVAEPLDFI